MSEIECKRASKRYNEGFKKIIVDLHQLGNLVEDLTSEYGGYYVYFYGKRWLMIFSLCIRFIFQKHCCLSFFSFNDI